MYSLGQLRGQGWDRQTDGSRYRRGHSRDVKASSPCGLEAKSFGLGLSLSLALSGLGLDLGLMSSGLGLIEIGLVA